MANEKKFQSGREIFEQYIPDYFREESELDDGEAKAEQFVEAILCDFSSQTPRRSKRNAAND